MHRRISILFIASIFIGTVYSDNVLKCYMCTSLSNEGCGSDLIAKSLYPVECTGNNILEWQRTIQQHKVLGPIAYLFEVDETLHFQIASHNMACVKTILNVDNQDVIVRTCQMAKTKIIDPCRKMEEKLKGNLGEMKQCALCVKDACNGATFLSLSISYIFMLLAGTLIHIAFYH